MSYSDFTLDGVCRAFTLDLDESRDPFEGAGAVAVSEPLRAARAASAPLALAMHSEKARSEFIVAPILAEVWKLMKHRITVFSGIDFTVAPSQGWSGTCDFIHAASPIQLFLRAPLVPVVAAENDTVKSSLGPCVADTIGARMFNEREGDGPSTIHGAVTTGSLWRFLKLDRERVFIDRTEYHGDQIGTILAILVRCVGGEAAVKVGVLS